MLSIMLILLAIAYVTLHERHVLGIMQLRLGASKTGLMGMVQPLLDGIKLLTKENTNPLKSDTWLFYMVGGLALILMFLEFCVIPKVTNSDNMNYSMLFLLVVVGLMVYCPLIGGVMSNSKYAFIGGLRNCVQGVSYEVVFALLLMLLMHIKAQLEVTCMLFSFMFNFIFISLWLLILLVELNRTPFDFSEAESELVSGFNTEYSSVNFVLFFLSEYGSIIFFSLLTSILFSNGLLFIMSSMVYIIITLRASLPRFRFDYLMKLTWMQVLPLVLAGLLFMLVIFT